MHFFFFNNLNQERMIVQNIFSNLHVMPQRTIYNTNANWCLSGGLESWEWNWIPYRNKHIIVLVDLTEFQ